MWRVAVVAGTLATAPAAAQEITAEQAMANHRRSVAPASRECPRTPGGEDIIVCGRREDNRYRAPLYATPDSGPAAQAGGEQRAAMDVGSSRCTTVGRNQSCGHLDFVGMALMIARGIVQAIIDGEDGD